MPSLGSANFIAPNAVVVGDVTAGRGSSVWYGAVLRGDLHPIQVGEHTLVQDNVVIKREAGREPVRIGKNVVISPNCRIGGCVVQDYAFIGMGSTLEDGCTVESYGVVAAGACVPRGAVVRSGQIFAGSPAQYLRDVTAEEREALHEHANESRSLAGIHAEEAEKSFEQVFLDDVLRERQLNMSHAEHLWERFEKIGYMSHPIDAEEIDLVYGTQYNTMYEREQTQLQEREWRPFTEDASVYPQGWKLYGEDMERYERAKRLFDQPPKHREELEIARPVNQTPWTRRF